MPENISHPDGHLIHSSVHYEHTDANARWILGIVGASLVFLLVLQALVFAFFVRYRDHLADVRRSPFPLAQQPSETLPLQPRLEQLNRLSDARGPFEREAARLRLLESYGPTPTKGVIHVPIHQAMRHLVAAKPLDTRSDAPEQRRRSAGLVDAGESNSGRLLRENK